MVSDADLARIALSLDGPHLVRELLTDTDHHTDGFDLDLLATILSEGPPEKCLLILACAASHVCTYGTVDPALRVSLMMLADNVFDDYAPLYLRHLKSPQTSVDASHYEAQILYMQDDLEGFAELFALAGDVSEPDTPQYQVCAILSDQAMAQAEYLDDLDPDIDYAPDAPMASAQDHPSLILFTDNVVPFPGLLRKN